MLLNSERLDLLKNDESKEENQWLKELILNVIEDLDTRMKIICNLKAENVKELISEFHKVNGVAANFGIEELHEKALYSEKLLKNGNVSEVILDRESTLEIWEKSKTELKNYINKLV